jgi:UPF0755 protein
MTSRTKILLACCAGLLVVAAVAVPKAWHFYYDRKVPNFSSTTEIYVYPDTDADALLEEVLDVADVRNAASFRRAFKEAFQNSDPEPGHYTISSGNTSAYVARMLSHGWQTPVKLVLSGTMRQQGAIARQISGYIE